LKIDAFGYCPHHPNAKIDTFGLNCAYRKPNSELISNFLRLYKANNLKSIFIGNTESDRLASDAVNVKYFDISQVKTSNFVRDFTNAVS
jgi:D-glycero-D-manno-heptose 1,7-bisphosphate phosphatase